METSDHALVHRPYAEWRLSTSGVDGAARAVAYADLDARGTESTSLVAFQSGGAVLVIGDADAAWSAALALPDTLRRVVLATSGQAPAGAVGSEEPAFVAGSTARVVGHLGEFTASIEAEGRPAVDIGALYLSPKPRFDLVLDLQAEPIHRAARPPLGYYATRGDADALARALAELPDLVGEFEKPRFFHYEPSLCAHDRSGLGGCTRCIDACSTQAISSLGDLVQVDPYLCQGDGICTTVCPSGAMRYAFPSPRDLLGATRRLLKGYAQAGGTRPVLLLHDGEAGAALLAARAAELPGNVLPLQVEEISATGIDVWLSALAYGAESVRLLATPAIPPGTVAALDRQIGIAHALLAGMGHAASRLSRIDIQAVGGGLGDAAVTFPAAGFDTANNKRETLRFALGHLYRHAPAPQPQVDLPAGAPFGEVRVDAKACTLCMGCVQVCPSHALGDGGDEKPQLGFTEDLCLQCGLCEKACPEDAISLAPRFVYDFEVRRQRRVLNEEEPFCCIDCGTPFATPSVIERMLGRLVDHPMFQDEASRNRMRMCGDCRVKALMREDIGRFKREDTA